MGKMKRWIKCIEKHAAKIACQKYACHFEEKLINFILISVSSIWSGLKLVLYRIGDLAYQSIFVSRYSRFQFYILTT